MIDTNVIDKLIEITDVQSERITIVNQRLDILKMRLDELEKEEVENG